MSKRKTFSSSCPNWILYDQGTVGALLQRGRLSEIERQLYLDAGQTEDGQKRFVHSSSAAQGQRDLGRDRQGSESLLFQAGTVW